MAIGTHLVQPYPARHDLVEMGCLVPLVENQLVIAKPHSRTKNRWRCRARRQCVARSADASASNVMVTNGRWIANRGTRRCLSWKGLVQHHASINFQSFVVLPLKSRLYRSLAGTLAKIQADLCTVSRLRSRPRNRAQLARRTDQDRTTPQRQAPNATAIRRATSEGNSGWVGQRGEIVSLAESDSSMVPVAPCQCCIESDYAFLIQQVKILSGWPCQQSH